MLIFIIIIIIIFIIYYRCNQLKNNSYWKHKNKKKLIKLNNLLKYVYFNILFDISTFLVGGTLLGCVRSGSIISYDDDVDIGIYIKKYNITNITEIIRNRLTNTFILKKTFYGFKIINAINKNIFLDIFIYVLYPNGIIANIYKKSRDIWKKDFFYYSEINNLSNGYLYNIKYKIPSNTIKVLYRNYGLNCLNELRITHLHTIDKLNKRKYKVIDIIDNILIKILKKLNLNQVN